MSYFREITVEDKGLRKFQEKKLLFLPNGMLLKHVSRKLTNFMKYLETDGNRDVHFQKQMITCVT